MSKILNNLDKNLSKILIPWAFRHPYYIFTFKRLAKIVQKNRRNKKAGGNKRFKSTALPNIKRNKTVQFKVSWMLCGSSWNNELRVFKSIK